MNRTTIWIATLAVMAAVGCGSKSAQSKQKVDTVDGLKKLIDDGTRGRQTIASSRDAMNGLTTAKDLDSAFNTFSKRADEVRKLGADMTKLNQKLRDRSAEYLKVWEDEVAKIADPLIAGNADDRRKAVSERIDTIRQQFKNTDAAYKPYMQTLTDIQTALKLDLNRNGVNAVLPAIQRGGPEADELLKQTDELLAQLNAAYAGLAATPK